MGVWLAARRNCVVKASAAAGVPLAGLLTAGCAHEPASPQRASVESCTRFAISALKHHVTVTSLPAACQGLTKAQVSTAAGAALDAIAGTVHGKVRMRARELKLGPLLTHLAPTVPVPRGLPSVSASAAHQASGPPLGIVALFAWLITVGLGSLMMARWIAHGGPRGGRGGKAGFPPAMNIAHFGLAVAGLVTWIIYLVTGLTGLAWIACVLLLPVAGLGMALVGLWFPERSPVAATVSPVQSAPIAADAARVQGSPDPPPAQHPPALVVAAHVAFAVATILFTLLAAVGSG